MKSKMSLVIIILWLVGCNNAETVNQSPFVKYNMEIDASKLAIKSTKLIEEYKKIDPKYKVENNYYIFIENDIRLIVGEYEGNIGLTGPEVQGQNIDELVKSVNKINKINTEKGINTSLLKNKLLQLKTSSALSIEECNVSIQKIKDMYYVLFDEFE